MANFAKSKLFPMISVEESVNKAPQKEQDLLIKTTGVRLFTKLAEATSQLTVNAHRGVAPSRYVLQSVVLEENQAEIENRLDALSELNQTPKDIIDITLQQLSSALEVARQHLKLDGSHDKTLLRAFEIIRCSANISNEVRSQASHLNVIEEDLLKSYNDFYAIYEGANLRVAKADSRKSIPSEVLERSANINSIINGSLDADALTAVPTAIHSETGIDRKLLDAGVNPVDRNSAAEIISISVEPESINDAVVKLISQEVVDDAILILTGKREDILSFIYSTADINKQFESLGVTENGQFNFSIYDELKKDSREQKVSRSPLMDPNLVEPYTLAEAKLGMLISGLMQSAFKTHKSVVTQSAPSVPGEPKNPTKITKREKKTGLSLPSESRDIVEYLLPYFGADLFFGSSKIDKILSASFENSDPECVGSIVLRYSKFTPKECEKCFKLSNFFDKMLRKSIASTFNTFRIVPFSAEQTWQSNYQKLSRNNLVTVRSDSSIGLILDRPDIKDNWIDLSASISLRTMVDSLNEYLQLIKGMFSAATLISEEICKTPKERQDHILNLLKEKLGKNIASHLDSTYNFGAMPAADFQNLCDSIGIRIRRIATQIIDVPFSDAISIAKQIVEETPNLLTISATQFVDELPKFRTEYQKSELDDELYFKAEVKNLVKAQPVVQPQQKTSSEEKPLVTVNIKDVYYDLLLSIGVMDEDALSISEDYFARQKNLKPLLRKILNTTDEKSLLRTMLISQPQLWLSGQIFDVVDRISAIKFLLGDLVPENLITSKDGILDHISAYSSEILLGQEEDYQDYVASLTSLFDTIKAFSLNPNNVLSRSPSAYTSTDAVNLLNDTIRENAVDELRSQENLSTAKFNVSVSDLRKRRGNIEWENAFFDKDTQGFCYGIRTSRFPDYLRHGVEEIINVLHTMEDFSSLKRGRLRLHTLSNSKVRWAMSTPDMGGYRVCFNWKDGKVKDIWIGDYHKKEDQKLIALA